jgi:hypothetical protein
MDALLKARRTGHVCVLVLASLLSVTAYCQDDDIKPVPILTGYTADLTRVTAGQVQNQPWVVPVLLAPIGDKWLVEGRAAYWPTFAEGSNGQYQVVSNEYTLQYAQVDYIASRYATVVAGQFLTPFGIYNERLAPFWIRALQSTPLSNSVTSNTSLGGMLRGGFPAGTQKVNLNYALYYSTANTNHIMVTDRSTGGRLGFFLPGPRLEIGASFQQLLQGNRYHAAGMHLEWQPNALPLTVRSEFVRSSGLNGSAYWIESVYRLSQVRPLRRLELVGRAEQFFADSNLAPALVPSLGALGLDRNEGDFGLNYYLTSDVRGSASYGRQFALDKDANLWVIGITYRFVMPLGPAKGGAL